MDGFDIAQLSSRIPPVDSLFVLGVRSTPSPLFAKAMTTFLLATSILTEPFMIMISCPLQPQDSESLEKLITWSQVTQLVCESICLPIH